MSDALTEMMRGLRLDGVDYGRCQPSAPWATAFPTKDEAQFHFLAAGEALVQTPVESMPRKAVCDGIVDLQCPCADSKNLLFFAVMRFNVDKRHPLLQL